MDLISFRDRYTEYVSQLEEFQQDLHDSVLELLSPAYSNDTLPSFLKRIKYRMRLNLNAHHGAPLSSSPQDTDNNNARTATAA